MKFALLTASIIFSGQLFAQNDCASVPPIDPGKDFVQNFVTPCYAIHFATAPGGGGGLGADLNATYNRAFYRVNPRYEIIIVGAYPKARYMSITPYDSHLAVVKSLYDAQITPLAPSYENPFDPGVQYKPGQLYAATITLGGTEPKNEDVKAGCSINGYNIHGNMFDGTERHPGLSWNGQPNLPAWFPVHNDYGPNDAGEIDVRQYMNQPVPGRDLTTPIILVRDLHNGCAVLPSKVLAVDGKPQTSDMVVANDINAGGQWLSTDQVNAHTYYAKNIQTKYCSYTDPLSQVNWFGNDSYGPSTNPFSGYAGGPLAPGWLNTSKFIRIRTRLPQTAKIPCAGCSLTGIEQLRYWSISFSSGGATFASVDDTQVVRDPNGYVTIVAGFSAAPPPQVTAANGYTYVNLGANGAGLTQLSLRTILPLAGFSCSASNIPLDTMEFNIDGGYMGEYVPAVDLLAASQIPPVASPLKRADSCTLVPPPPKACTLEQQ